MGGKPIFEIVLGSYEKYLIGYSLFRDKINDSYNFVRTFAEEAHNGCIKSVATSSTTLVSGGTDECIRIFDMIRKKDVASLFNQEGTITCLNFIDDQHLISGSEDASICVWTTTNWKCAKTLLGHKGPVKGLSVHPAGGLALSVSKDKAIRTWDLVKGRCAFITNIKEVANNIIWAPSGKQFLVLFDRRIDVYDVNIAAPIHKIPFTKNVNCARFINESIAMIGMDDGCLEMINIMKNKSLKNQKIHETRIKDICLTSKGVLTASSDGVVKFCRGQNFTTLAETNLGCRITCMSVFPPQPNQLPSKSKAK